VTDHLRAAGYLRVSGATQSGDLHVSLPVQREKFLAHCAAKRYIPSGEFLDVESGRRDSRKEYQRMLTAARAHQIDVIVVQRLDRFGRNPREILRRIWELQDIGVVVESTDEDLTHEISVMLHAFMAGEESKRISARVIPTMERVVREGRWPGGAPFGYQVIQDRASPQRGKLVVDEREAAIVRRIFDLYVAGNLGWSKVAEILNQDQVPGPRRAVWWASTVEVILRNAAYIGRPKWRGIELVGGCPHIVDIATWERAAAIIASRKLIAVRKPPGEQFLLAGFIRCACGTYRAGWTVFRDNYVDRKGHRRKATKYYRCGHAANAHTCKVGLIPATVLDTWVLAQVSAWQVPVVLVPVVDDSAERRAKLAAERTRLKAKIERLRRRRETGYDNLMDAVVTKEQYRENDKRYLADLAEAEQELALLRDVTPARDPHEALAHLAAFQAALGSATTEELRLLLGELVERVDVVNRGEWRIVPKAELVDVLAQ